MIMLDNVSENSGQRETEKFVKSEKILPGSDGWLSPKGSYYKVEPNEHDESASFLVKNVDEVKEAAEKKYIDAWEKRDYETMNDRMKLIKLDWILVRGPILRSEDANNFSKMQLKRISEAGIKVVSAFGGAIEYSSDEVLMVTERICKDIHENPIINQWIKESETSYYPRQFYKEFMDDLKSFKESPLRSIIGMIGFGSLSDPNDLDAMLPREFFDVMSKGYAEEMKILCGLDTYFFREVNLKDGMKLWIKRIQHIHSGESGGFLGNYMDYLSMFVADEHLVVDMLRQLIDDRVNYHPKVELSENDGYFGRIMEKVVSG